MLMLLSMFLSTLASLSSGCAPGESRHTRLCGSKGRSGESGGATYPHMHCGTRGSTAMCGSYPRLQIAPGRCSTLAAASPRPQRTLTGSGRGWRPGSCGRSRASSVEPRSRSRPRTRPRPRPVVACVVCDDDHDYDGGDDDEHGVWCDALLVMSERNRWKAKGGRVGEKQKRRVGIGGWLCLQLLAHSLRGSRCDKA